MKCLLAGSFMYTSAARYQLGRCQHGTRFCCECALLLSAHLCCGASKRDLCNACIPACSVRYMNTFTYSRYKRTQQLSNGSRLKDSMRQFMASLTVEAYDLKIVKPQGGQLSAMLGDSTGFSGQHGATPSGLQTPPGGRRPGAAAATPGHADQVDRVRQTLDPKTPPRSGTGGSGMGSPSRGSPLKGQPRDRVSSFEEDNDIPGFSQGLIAAAACFLLRQAPVEGSGESGALASLAATAAIPVDPVRTILSASLLWVFSRPLM